MAHRIRMAGQQRIGGDQHQPFPLLLDHQQPIKGIAVQGRQLGHRQDMGGLNRNLLKASIQQAAPQQRRLHLETIAPQGRLEHQLPEGRQR